MAAGHGALAYGDLESAWPYQDVHEVQLAGVTNVALSVVVIPAALFAMGLFFLISGIVTPGSVSRKGPRRFARDRVVRLGLPLVVWALLLWPGAIWAAHLAAGDRYSFWWQLTHQDPILDTGPMWFAEVLLVSSPAYPAWRYRHRLKPMGEVPDEAVGRSVALSGRTLITLAAGISITTVLVRMVFPAASGQIGQSHLWQWPQFIVMFGLGIVAGQRGWLDPVPDRIRRGCGLPRWAVSWRSAFSARPWPPPGSTEASFSTAGSTGHRFRSPRSRVRSPSARRCGCLGSLNEGSTVPPVRSVALRRVAPTARSCSKASC